MRVVLVGTAAERSRLRAALRSAGVDVAGEFDTLTEAQHSDAEHPMVLADEGERPDLDDHYEEKLTSRELQVLELMTEGLPNKFIAERLRISDQTVKFHIASILGKLGAANRTDAVRRALRRGLVNL